MRPNIRAFSTLPSAYEFFRAPPSAYERFQAPPSAFELSRVLPSAFECFWTLPSAYEFFRALPSASDCLRAPPSASEYLRNFTLTRFNWRIEVKWQRKTSQFCWRTTRFYWKRPGFHKKIFSSAMRHIFTCMTESMDMIIVIGATKIRIGTPRNRFTTLELPFLWELMAPSFSL
jgi:hypothetical protein